jgi:hypothetical protein
LAAAESFANAKKQEAIFIDSTEPNTLNHYLITDPALYAMQAMASFQKGDTAVKQVGDKMQIVTVKDAQHPRYKIHHNDIDTISVDVREDRLFPPLTPTTTQVLHHQKFYKDAPESRYNEGDIVMYNDGSEAFQQVEVIKAAHPNYTVVDNTGTTILTTTCLLRNPAVCDMTYVLMNRDKLVELFSHASTIDTANDILKSSNSHIEPHHLEEAVKNLVDSPEFMKTTPFKLLEDKLTQVIDDIQNSNYKSTSEIKRDISNPNTPRKPQHRPPTSPSKSPQKSQYRPIDQSRTHKKSQHQHHDQSQPLDQSQPHPFAQPHTHEKSQTQTLDESQSHSKPQPKPLHPPQSHQQPQLQSSEQTLDALNTQPSNSNDDNGTTAPSSPKSTWNTDNEGIINNVIIKASTPQRKMITPSIGTTPVVQHWEQRLHGNNDSSSASTETIPVGIFSNNESILRTLKTKPTTSQDNQGIKGNSSEADFSDTSLLRLCESTDSPTPQCKTHHDDASSSSSENDSISEEGKKLEEDLVALENKLRRNRKTGYSSSSDKYST